MQIRTLVLSDAPQYRQLMLRAYREAADAFTSTPEERAQEPLSWWQQRIAGPQNLSLALGAFQAEIMVGAVNLEMNAKPKTRHKAHVMGMFVDGACRGLGVGKALMQTLIEQARQRDELRMLTLTATDGNLAAIELYKGCGFQQFGLEPMAICTPTGYQAKVHMCLDLTASASATLFSHAP